MPAMQTDLYWHLPWNVMQTWAQPDHPYQCNCRFN